MTAMKRFGRLLLLAATLLVAWGGTPGRAWVDGAVSTGDGIPTALCVAGRALVVGGTDTLPGNGEWRIERRSLETGALDAGFGGDGVVTSNPTFDWDRLKAVADDGTHLYAVGGDGGGAFPWTGRWRIEKRRLSDGTLDGGFGDAGVVVADSAGDGGPANAVAVYDGDLFVAGSSWRIERRRTLDGGLVSSFGDAGVLVGGGTANAVLVADGSLVVGGTPNFEDWTVERRDLQTGALLWTATEDLPDVGCGPQGVSDIAADATHVYLAGAAAGQWRIEKRRLSDGALVYGETLPGFGACDDARAITVDGTAMYVAGAHVIASRLEKRTLDDGVLVSSFGDGGSVGGVFYVDLFGYHDVVLHDGLLYLAKLGWPPATGDEGRIERRNPIDGDLVPGAPPATTTTTLPPGACRPLALSGCRVDVRPGRVPARARFDVQCSARLGARSAAIDPGSEAVHFSLHDAAAPPWMEPCFAQTVRPRRVGRCWVYTDAQPDSGLRRLKLCPVDPDRGTYRLAARSNRADLGCLSEEGTYAAGLSIGDECDGGSPATTTSTTVAPAASLVKAGSILPADRYCL